MTGSRNTYEPGSTTFNSSMTALKSARFSMPSHLNSFSHFRAVTIWQTNCASQDTEWDLDTEIESGLVARKLLPSPRTMVFKCNSTAWRYMKTTALASASANGLASAWNDAASV